MKESEKRDGCKIMGVPLTQDKLFAMGKQCRNSLAGKLAKDSSPINFGDVTILRVYETPETEREKRFYSVEFQTSEGKKVTFHKEYTCNLRILPVSN